MRQTYRRPRPQHLPGKIGGGEGVSRLGSSGESWVLRARSLCAVAPAGSRALARALRRVVLGAEAGKVGVVVAAAGRVGDDVVDVGGPCSAARSVVEDACALVAVALEDAPAGGGPAFREALASGAALPVACHQRGGPDGWGCVRGRGVIVVTPGGSGRCGICGREPVLNSRRHRCEELAESGDLERRQVEPLTRVVALRHDHAAGENLPYPFPRDAVLFADLFEREAAPTQGSDVVVSVAVSVRGGPRTAAAARARLERRTDPEGWPSGRVLGEVASGHVLGDEGAGGERGVARTIRNLPICDGLNEDRSQLLELLVVVHHTVPIVPQSRQ